MVDSWLAAFVDRKVQEAKDVNPVAIVIEIDTYGGAIFAEELITRSIEKAAPIPTVAYVKKAVSAGAFIAFSCNKIYMRQGARMGSAKPILLGQQGPVELDPKTEEKLVSDARAAIRSLAEKNGHNKALAEAMVDSEVEVVEVKVGDTKRIMKREEFDALLGHTALGEAQPTIERVVVKRGELLNVTAEEALALGLSSGTVADRDDLLAVMGYPKARVVEASPRSHESLARVFQGPVVSGLILSLGTLAVVLGLYTGSATALGIGFFCFGFFFWSKFMAGTAGLLEMVLFIAGFILLAVEVFAIPGFGVTGVTGIILIATSLVLSMLPPGFTGFGESSKFVAPYRWTLIAYPLGAVLFAFVSAGVGFAVLARYIKFVPFLGRVVMQTEIAPGTRPDQAPEGRPAMTDVALSVGDAGVARTDLRPGGKALFGDRTVMVVADSEFIESGARVKVTEVKGKTVVVVRA